jgi:hypothetical protein
LSGFMQNSDAHHDNNILLKFNHLI